MMQHLELHELGDCRHHGTYKQVPYLKTEREKDEIEEDLVDELVIDGKVVFWYKAHGIYIHKRFTFSTQVVDAVFCRFHQRFRTLEEHKEETKDDSQNSAATTDMFLCILSDPEKITAHSNSGPSFEVALPFRASKIHALSFGILIEREDRQEGTNDSNNGTQNQQHPVLFSLIHPLEEIKPIAICTNEFLMDSDEKICFTSLNEDFLVTYHVSDMQYTLWTIQLQEQQLNTTQLYNSRWTDRNNITANNDKSLYGKNLNHNASMNSNFTWNNYSKCGGNTTYQDPLNASELNMSMHNTTSMFDMSTTSQYPHPSPIVAEVVLTRIWSTNIHPTEEHQRRMMKLNYPSSFEWSNVFLAMDSNRVKLLCIHDSIHRKLRLFAIDALNRIEERGTIPCTTALPIQTNANNVKRRPKEHHYSFDIVALYHDHGLGLFRGNVHMCELSFPSLKAEEESSSSMHCHFDASVSPVMPVLDQMSPVRQNTTNQQPTPVPSLSISSIENSITASELSEDSLLMDVFQTPNKQQQSRSPSSNRHHSYTTERTKQTLVSITNAHQNYFDVVFSKNIPSLRVAVFIRPHFDLLADVLDTFDSCLPFEVSKDIRMDVMKRIQCTSNEPSSVSVVDTSMEWQAFLNNLADYFQSRSTFTKPAPSSSTNSAWNQLLQSTFHSSYRLQLPRGLQQPKMSVPSTNASSSSSTTNDGSSIHFIQQASKEQVRLHFRQLFVSFHLLYEDYKCSILGMVHVRLLLPILVNFSLVWMDDGTNNTSSSLSGKDYLDHYIRDFQPQNVDLNLDNQPLFHPVQFRSDHPELFNGVMPRPFETYAQVPSIYRWMLAIFSSPSRGPQGTTIESFPMVSNLSRTASIIKCYNVLFQSQLDDDHTAPLSATSRVKLLVETMLLTNFTTFDMKDLPFGILVPLRQALDFCRNIGDYTMSKEGYELIGRMDLALLKNTNTTGTTSFSGSAGKKKNQNPKNAVHDLKNENDPNENDPNGLELMETITKKRFGKDRRISEVCKLLNSSRVASIRLERRPEVSTDNEHTQAEQTKLRQLVTRSFALSVGRGMFTLGTLNPRLTEPLAIPTLNVIGRTLDNTTVRLESPAPGFSDCPEFHNGVASGLRLLPGLKKKITRTWIVYHRPEEPSYFHAGLLMALGLRGYLSSLAMTDVFDYLSQGHDATTTGILLGMAAAKAGSMDRSVSKMLCLHIPSLLPPPFAELEVAASNQTASLIGIGLLYRASGHRLMTEFLLNEIGKRPTSDRLDDRESYVLSAGMALGLVTLGCGASGRATGLADLQIENRLHRYIQGGKKGGSGDYSSSMDGSRTGNHGSGESPHTNSASNHTGTSSSSSSNNHHHSDADPNSKCSRIREGSAVNVQVTSAGAMIALGLMFLKSEQESVASRLSVPDTLFLLQGVRPDLLVLRVVMKHLILWQRIEPSEAWLRSQVPLVLRQHIVEEKENQQPQHYSDQVDTELIGQAYVNILAGACFALGLRYASTSSKSATQVILDVLEELRHLRTQGCTGSSKSTKRAKCCPDRTTLDRCLGLVAQSLALVLAGSGQVVALRLFRELRVQLMDPTGSHYGHQMSIAMSIGLLFLGGGRTALCRSNHAIAALVISLYPMYPQSTLDNVYHLQALRHLYVLATEPRYLECVDVETSEDCYLPFVIELKDQQSKLECIAPCLLPVEVSDIHAIHMDSPRYYSLHLDISGCQELRDMLNFRHVIYVQRKTGHLPYSRDSMGIRSLVARACPQPPGGPSFGARAGWASVLHSFSEDPTVRAFGDCFLNCNETQHPEEEEDQALSEFATATLYECLTRDKDIAVVAVYLAIYTLISTMLDETTPITGNALGLANLRLVVQYYETQAKNDDFGPALIHSGFLTSVVDRVESYFELKELDIIQQYIRWNGRVWQEEEESQPHRFLALYLTYVGFPTLVELRQATELTGKDDDREGTMIHIEDLCRLDDVVVATPSSTLVKIAMSFEDGDYC